MATKRRKTRRRKAAAVAVNPRRTRRRARRRNPIVARSVRRTSGKRRYSRRRNPSASSIGGIFKQMVYGAGGAVATRVGAGIAEGFVPGSLAGSKLTRPVLQAAVAATLVRWGGSKFLGKPAGDLMMIGGLISAGLELTDAFLPGVQNQLTSIIRAPIGVAQTIPQQLAAAGASPDVIAQAGASMAGYRDVEEVPDSAFAGMRGGLGDVEDVPMGVAFG